MYEWRRIWANGKRRAILLGIPLLCLALFFYQKCNGDFGALLTDSQEYQALVDTYRTSTPEEIEAQLDVAWGMGDNSQRLLEQAEHLTSYADYLAQIQQQAANMLSSSLFNSNRNSFTYRNIIKTAEDFANCSADGVYFGNYRAVQDWLAFDWADWAYLVATVLLVMAFVEERQKGLTAIIRSCPAGRGHLQATRLGILACHSVIMTLLLYFVPLMLSLCIDGGWADLLRPVQSMAEFRTCTAQLSILEFLGQFFLVKAACGLLLGLLIWFALSFLNQVQLSWMLTAAALTAEYLLYTLIPAQSIFSPLRYVNVFSYVFSFGLYTQYGNINFLGWPVQSRAFLLTALAVLVTVLSILVLWALPKRHPFGAKDRLGKWLHLWNRAGDWLRRRLGVFGFEWYKLLFLTAGGLFLVLGLLLTQKINVSSGAYNRVEDIVYRQYVAQIQGPVTQSTYDYLDDAREALASSDLDTAEFASALDALEETLAALPDGAWLVDEAVFLNVYGPNAWRTQRQNGLIALILLAACLSPLFACEQSGDVRKLLRSAPGGRLLFPAKYGVALGVTAIVWAWVFGREWQAAAALLGDTILSAPCGSIGILQGYSMSIGAFLALFYLVKGLALLIPMHLCIFFGERSRGFETAFLLSGAVLLIPAAVCSFGVDFLQGFTVLQFLADVNVLTLSGLASLAVWMAASLAALALARRHWGKT